MEYTKEIVTPMGKHKVVIKTMISGAEREQIEAAELDFVQTSDGKSFNVPDMKKVPTARKHELLKVSVVTIDGDATDCLPRLLKMFEPDYNFVHNEILETQKKMMESTSAAS